MQIVANRARSLFLVENAYNDNRYTDRQIVSEFNKHESEFHYSRFQKGTI